MDDADSQDPNESEAMVAGLSQLSGAEMAELLERIPGACERVATGIADAREGRTIALED